LPEFPEWTEFCSNETEHRGLDPLGLESVGAGIVQNQLLPGITNATRHIRYYSFFSWVFWKFWSGKGEKARLSAQRRRRVRLENVLRAATLDKDEKIQALIGVTKAIRINGLPGKAKVSIEGGKAATAFIPANYSSSFRALGCGMWEYKKGAKLTAFGEELALALDEGFDRVSGGRIALKEMCSDAAEISVAAIRSAADAIRLRPVGPTEAEHTLLLELLLRMDTGDDRVNASFDMERSRSLALFMEITDQAEGTLSSASDLHQIFATGRLPNRRTFSVPPELQQSFEVWMRYQERQYVKLSIYALWREVVQLLGYAAFKTVAAQQLLTHLSIALTNSDLAEKWLGNDCPRLKVGAALQSLSKDVSFRPRGEFGKKASALAGTLMNLNTSTEERVGAAVVLLLLSGCYWKSNSSTLPESQLHKRGGAERISLEAIYKDLGRLADCNVADYLQWAVENYVLKQATRVAIYKLPDYRFFITRDEEGYRLVKRQDPRSYLSYDSSRIGSAFELMTDLELVEINSAITLTATGRKVLQKLRTFHQRMNANAAVNAVGV
jgi:hypothetical protein